MRPRHSGLTHFQTSELPEYLVSATSARIVANWVGISRNTVRQLYHRLCRIIDRQIKEECYFDGRIEVDESSFGSIRKGRRSREATGKVAIWYPEASQRIGYLKEPIDF